MEILSTIYFEKIFPVEFHKPLKCIQTSQSRMTLQDALKLPLSPTWLRASNHYLEHLTRMVEFCKEYPHTILKNHPNFEWSINDRHILRSSCWWSDIAMCHMINGFVYQEEAKKCMDIKEANKQLKNAQTSFDDMHEVLTHWSFKVPEERLACLNPSWSKAKSHYCKAMQAFMGFQFSIQEEKQKTMLVASKKMERDASFAIQEWASPEAYDALNIARVVRACSHAIDMHETDRGGAIALMNQWTPLIDQIDVKEYPKVTEWLERCKESHKRWVNENNQVYFDPVPAHYDLPSIH